LLAINQVGQRLRILDHSDASTYARKVRSSSRPQLVQVLRQRLQTRERIVYFAFGPLEFAFELLDLSLCFLEVFLCLVVSGLCAGSLVAKLPEGLLQGSN
jgi:hypothetical protein